MADALMARVEAALAARQSLIDAEQVTAFRLLNGRGDGVPGLVVEKLASVLVAQVHEDRLRLPADAISSAVEGLHERLDTRAVYRKVFVRDRSHAPAAMRDELYASTPWMGEPVEPELTVAEPGLRFVVRPYDGFATGLFLEHRDNRRRVRELAANARVLNAFAYTCSFSVAAAAGGAAGVHSIDLARRCLEWGKRNFAVNGLDAAPHRFFSSDVFDFYRRAARLGYRYDLIILDPPTFSRQRRPHRVFTIEEDLPQLVEGAIRLLDLNGLILLATNHRQTSRARLEEVITTAAAGAGRRCAQIERPPLPLDFAGDKDYSKAVLVRVA